MIDVTPYDEAIEAAARVIADAPLVNTPRDGWNNLTDEDRAAIRSIAVGVFAAAERMWHGNPTTVEYWGCVAHSEGQTCCLDLLADRSPSEATSTR